MEMVALGVDAEDEEEHAVLDGAAVEGVEDGGGVGNVGLELLEPLLDEQRAADGEAVAHEAASSIPLADGDVVEEPKLAAAVGVIGDVDGGVEVGAGLRLKLEVKRFGEVEHDQDVGGAGGDLARDDTEVGRVADDVGVVADAERLSTRDGSPDGLEDVLGLGEGKEEAAARAALLDASRGEDANGGEGATTGGDGVDELAGWLGVEEEEVGDGLTVTQGEDVFPISRSMFWKAASASAPKMAPPGRVEPIISRAWWTISPPGLMPMPNCPPLSARLLPTFLARQEKTLRPAHRRHISPMAMGRMASLPSAS